MFFVEHTMTRELVTFVEISNLERGVNYVFTTFKYFLFFYQPHFRWSLWSMGVGIHDCYPKYSFHSLDGLIMPLSPSSPSVDLCHQVASFNTTPSTSSRLISSCLANANILLIPVTSVSSSSLKTVANCWRSQCKWIVSWSGLIIVSC